MPQTRISWIDHCRDVKTISTTKLQESSINCLPWFDNNFTPKSVNRTFFVYLLNNITLHRHEHWSMILCYWVSSVTVLMLSKTWWWVISLRQMVKMSTGHMEGDLQPLYLLLTDCYIYLLRKGEQADVGNAPVLGYETGWFLKCLYADYYWLYFLWSLFLRDSIFQINLAVDMFGWYGYDMVVMWALNNHAKRWKIQTLKGRFCCVSLRS